MSFSIEIIAVGKLKSSSPFYTLFDKYARRMQGKVSIVELEGRSQAEELKKIEAKLSPSSPLIVLDEKGKSIPSLQFAKKLEDFQNYKSGTFQFVIGGADGLNDTIRKRADLVIGFGAQTWPHMMVRVMLIEQIYRAQQILINHPYHRE